MTRLTALAMLLLAYSAIATVSAAPAEIGAISPVTGSQCVECHDSESQTHVYHGDCASCHAGADAHSQAEKPKTVKVDMPATEQCLSCHDKDARRMNFAFAEHDRAGIQCSDCHGLHSPKVKTLNAGMEKAGEVTALCSTCHQDVMARFNMQSHHPVKEGGLSCNSCHDPHSGKQTTLVGKTAECTQCHQAVRGPHAFEHAPAAEDCTNCHDPHGSPNRKMLALAQPMLCLQCHSVAGNRHGADGTNTNGQIISATALRNCSSCHNAPHGSHMDQHLRY